ncbi:hypothetical protein UJ101_02087 [Flavobacteriaceae bacterium UJ101]|nr:hypothetical protein UJ101_02087 [Flavobacteriaceae bacterium UJ101]
MKKIGLLPRLLLAIVFGIVIGLLCHETDFELPVKLFATFSGLFGNFLSFIIPLVILGFIAPGIADLGAKAGRLLGITAIIAYVSSFFAGIAAYFIGITGIPYFLTDIQGTKVPESEGLEFFTISMPAPIGVMSALILAFVLGLGMAYAKTDTLKALMKDFNTIIIDVLKYIIVPLIPIHIGAQFVKLAYNGDVLNVIIAFAAIIAMIVALQILYIIIQFTLQFLFTGKNPIQSIYNMLPAYLTALGTQSSAATIPISLESSRNNGVEEDILDFVVPLCANIHLAGDTIALVLGAMGIAYITNGELQSFGEILPFIAYLGVMMVAAPGIPGGGAVAARGLMESMLGFSVIQLDLITALHFSQDSFGTATNVTGDGAIALIIDKINKILK